VSVQKLPEHLTSLWHVSSKEGRDVFKATAEVLGETLRVERNHACQVIESLQFP
jgi:hypothetical protein